MEGKTGIDDFLLENPAEALKELPAEPPEPDYLGEIAKLAKLPAIEYEQTRVAASERLKIRTSILDKLVAESRKTEKPGGIDFEEIEPYHKPVNPADLLDSIEATVKRFIICNLETAVAVALWVAMTWLMDAVHVAPLAIITAPDKRCGKSRLLALIGKLVKRPIMASGISPAALFRSIEKWGPTLLIDEADAFMKGNEEIRLLLNSGHTRDAAFIIRTVGDDHEPTRFNTWGAKVICGISAHKLADTLTDRAVLLELRRKLPNEAVENLRHAEPHLFSELTSKLARFADDNGELVRLARPDLPPSLNDRAQDNWEPLLAVADAAGGAWPDRARRAAMKISGTDSPEMSTSAELLQDIKDVFSLKQIDRISSANLILELCVDEEGPWKTYNRGFPITQRQLSNRLKEYHILSRTVKTGYQETAKGFLLEQFKEAFDRYLSATPLPSVTTSPNSIDACLEVTERLRVTDENVTSNQNVTSKTSIDAVCDVVTDKTGNAPEVEVIPDFDF